MMKRRRNQEWLTWTVVAIFLLIAFAVGELVAGLSQRKSPPVPVARSYPEYQNVDLERVEQYLRQK